MSILDLPTAELMSAGGDDRITLDEQSGLNSYGCAPEPIRAISYSSSTASSISAPAYAHAHAVHHQLRLAVAQGETEHASYTRFLGSARSRIRRVYGLASDVDVAFGASGTDLEYLALALALQTGQKVTNIVVEVDEVGSGCLYSQAGQYFADRTALGHKVIKGAHLPGFGADVIAVKTLKTRTDDGPMRSDDEYTALLLHAVGEVVSAGGRPLVHVIHRSKTGIVTPSLTAVDAVIAAFGASVDLVVDACQGRISPDTIAAYLARGASILLTGSKFIGGPPFSAWALVPAPLSARMNTGTDAPAGLSHFFARGDMPTGWHDTNAVLPSRTNFGLLLRLEAALFELERLLAMPMDRVDTVIRAFTTAMGNLPTAMPFRLLEGSADEYAAGDHLNQLSPAHPLDRKMLYVIKLTDRIPGTGAALDIEQARAVYRALYTDMSDAFAKPHDALVAAEICHVGQPVKCLRFANGDWAPTLRLSLSAPQIFEMIGLDADRLVERFSADIERIAAKIRLVIANLD